MFKDLLFDIVYVLVDGFKTLKENFINGIINYFIG